MNDLSRRASHPAPTTQERSNVTRARLLDVAVRAFAGTSTRDIATAVGLSPAAVYVHFDSKEEVLYQICQRGYDTSLWLVEVSLAQSEDPSEQLPGIIRAFALDHTRNYTSGRVVNYELESLSPQHRT